jgi:hypothetical protein
LSLSFWFSPSKSYMHSSSAPLHATCRARRILPNLNILIILGDEYNFDILNLIKFFVCLL